MTSNKRKTIIISIISSCVILCLVSAIKFLYDFDLPYPKGLSDFIDTGDYAIAPQTILSDLNHRKTDVFTPVTVTHEFDTTITPYPSGSFPWKQSDYLIVADALHQFVWNDTLDKWYIFGMIFSRGCQDNPVGFDSADITYYKQANKQSEYIVHEMDIYPIGGGVSWGGSGGFKRPLFGWTNINIGWMRVTADDALQMAEEHGGKQFRLKYNNACDINIILKPNGDVSDWIIYYDNDGSLHTFNMYINPYFGWYKILPNK